MMPLNILYIGNKLSSKGFTPTGIETLGPILEQEGYNISYASSKKNPALRMLEMILTTLLLRNNVQVVLIDVYSTTAFYYTYIVAGLCRLIRLPYIAILHGGNLPQRLKQSPNKSASVFKHSVQNIALSAYMQQALQQSGHHSLLIPNSINIANYPHKSIQRVIGNILWVRSFHHIYNPQMAVRLIEMLAKKYPAIHLTMVGPDKDGTLAACQLLAKELGVADKITFTGMLPKQEWTKLAATHDVFINTASFDNMPFSIIEAMALGLPIVSTNVGGIPALINNNDNGLLVERDDVAAMCNAIEYLMQHNTATAKLSMQARLTAESFDWQNIKHKWIELLDTVEA